MCSRVGGSGAEAGHFGLEGLNRPGLAVGAGRTGLVQVVDQGFDLVQALRESTFDRVAKQVFVRGRCGVAVLMGFVVERGVLLIKNLRLLRWVSGGDGCCGDQSLGRSVMKRPLGASALTWRRVWPSMPPLMAHSANTVGPGVKSRGCQSAVSSSSSV